MDKVLLMGHEAKFRIKGQVAEPDSEDKIVVWLDFGDKPVGSTIAFAVELPVKEYKPDEFLKLVQVEGEKRLREFGTLEEDRAYRSVRKVARQKELDELASRLKNSLQEYGGIR